LSPSFPAESWLKDHLSVFPTVKQLFTSRLKAERQNEKVIKKGRLSHKNNDSIANGTVWNKENNSLHFKKKVFAMC
jgi:hypothetical protein